MKTLLLLFISGIFSLFGGIYGLKKILPLFAAVALATAMAYLTWDYQHGIENLGRMLVFNDFSYAFMMLALGASFLIAILSAKGFDYGHDNLGDLLGLIFFILCGVACMVSYNNLVMLFLGIEIVSIPLYVMAGSNRNRLKSNEAALKYFIMGGFATGFLLFGLALIYGCTRSFDMDAIRSMSLSTLPASNPMATVGMLLVTVAFAFKIAAVPFHYWSPDVYEGSPTLVTAFMATVVKTAGIGAFLKFAIYLSPVLGADWHLVMSIIAAATIIVANITAIMQTDFKRMMAYSSVSHVGYLLMSLLVVNQQTQGIVVFYLIAYSLASIGVFACLMLINPDHNNGNSFEIFKGLGKRSPKLAIVLTVCLLSVSGIPPLPGFFAKYMLFQQAISQYLWLVIIGICGSAISIYYYFRAITNMFFTENTENTLKVEPVKNYAGYLVVAIACISIIILACFPGWFIK